MEITVTRMAMVVKQSISVNQFGGYKCIFDQTVIAVFTATNHENVISLDTRGKLELSFVIPVKHCALMLSVQIKVISIWHCCK